MRRLIGWWKSKTLNEKMMYGLIIVLAIGIVTRWKFVCKEIGAAFETYFGAFN